MNTNMMFEHQLKGKHQSDIVPVNHQHSADEARIALFNQLTGGDLNQLALLNAQQQRNLTFTTQEAAQRSVLEVLARHNTSAEVPADLSCSHVKRAREEVRGENDSKKQRTTSLTIDSFPNDDDSGPAPIPASEVGVNNFNDNDVLSGRGGGTNVHPGNRHFRDLINHHRRAYLKARKNDKPAISRAIVRTIRENKGAFLKRDEKTGLWFEIGDDAAREKTSQALRQRAPEMRKILFESEREQARQEAEDQLRQQQQFVTTGLSGNLGSNPTDLSVLGGSFNIQNLNQDMNHILSQQGSMLNPLFAMQMSKQGLGGPMGNLSNDPYSQMSQNLVTAALLGGSINRFTPNGA